MGLDQSRKMLFSKAEHCGPHDQISLKYQKYNLLFQKCQQEQNISEKVQKFTQQLCFGAFTHISLFGILIFVFHHHHYGQWTTWLIQTTNFVLIYGIRKCVANEILILRWCVLKLKSETFNSVWKISLRFEKYSSEWWLYWKVLYQRNRMNSNYHLEKV